MRAIVKNSEQNRHDSKVYYAEGVMLMSLNFIKDLPLTLPLHVYS